MIVGRSSGCFLLSLFAFILFLFSVGPFFLFFFFFLMIRRPPRSTHCISSAASDVYKRQVSTQSTWGLYAILIIEVDYNIQINSKELVSNNKYQYPLKKKKEKTSFQVLYIWIQLYLRVVQYAQSR
eukprot:TRINITY_DN11021_c0_g1_i5.p4 TRINITY_DN11021_c0_g1~~TRINITY_DN11021_c0_g1_i5.p4  ORF type:complete len:126 (+),score=35.32 TRINITY_DN11021_c0_g1_i5:38-415(+)